MWMLGKATDNRIFQSMSVRTSSARCWISMAAPITSGTCAARCRYGIIACNMAKPTLISSSACWSTRASSGFFRFQDDKHILVLCDDLQTLEPAGDVSELAFRETNADHRMPAAA